MLLMRAFVVHKKESSWKFGSLAIISLVWTVWFWIGFQLTYCRLVVFASSGRHWVTVTAWAPGSVEGGLGVWLAFKAGTAGLVDAVQTRRMSLWNWSYLSDSYILCALVFHAFSCSGRTQLCPPETSWWLWGDPVQDFSIVCSMDVAIATRCR